MGFVTGIRLGISSCLLGNMVRYDGGHKLDSFLTGTLGRYVEWIPVCPEVESGLSVPREAMQLLGDPSAPHIVTIGTGVDHTERIMSWARRKIAELQNERICGFVFKSRSPSCGIRDVEIYSENSLVHAKGPGLFARIFMESFSRLPVEDEARLYNPEICERFIERVLAICDAVSCERNRNAGVKK